MYSDNSEVISSLIENPKATIEVPEEKDVEPDEQKMSTKRILCNTFRTKISVGNVPMGFHYLQDKLDFGTVMNQIIGALLYLILFVLLIFKFEKLNTI